METLRDGALLREREGAGALDDRVRDEALRFELLELLHDGGRERGLLLLRGADEAAPGG